MNDGSRSVVDQVVVACFNGMMGRPGIQIMPRRRKEPDRFCLTCGYALHGLSEPRCPECGQPFDPKDPRTFVRKQPIRSALFSPWVAALFGYGGTSLAHGCTAAALASMLLGPLEQEALVALGLVLSMLVLCALIAVGRRLQAVAPSPPAESWGGILWDAMEWAGAIAAGLGLLLRWLAPGLFANGGLLIVGGVGLALFWLFVCLGYVQRKDSVRRMPRSNP
jgi:hypothetical protein